MAETQTQTTTTETEIAADDAERAARAAQEAAAAAAAATQAATVEAGNVAAQAEARLRAIEEEATSWRGQREQLETQRQAESSSRVAMEQGLTELRTQLGTLGEQLQLIQSRLAPPPDNPANPEGVPPEGANPTPPEEPQKPRRKAHRWI